MNEVVELKQLTISQKPLIECTFTAESSFSFPFEKPILTPQKLESFTLWAENEGQNTTDGIKNAESGSGYQINLIRQRDR